MWLFAIGLGVVGCGSTSPNDTTSDEDIYGGVRDDDIGSIPSPVVALRIAKVEICSGALIAPNVVLTARHCVAKNESATLSCDAEGRSLSGELSGDVAPAEVAVYVGTSPSFAQKPVAIAKAIFAPDETVLCNADLAVVVLDTDVARIAPLAVRFAAPPRLNETIRAVGYGRNDGRAAIGTRFRRERVPVLAIGKAITASKTQLGLREFEVGKSVCDGDSGGPAISELTGAVIGVVSRGAACGDDAGHVYTTTAGFDGLFEKAFAAAGHPPISETNTPPESAPPQEEATPAKPADPPRGETGCTSAAAGSPVHAGWSTFAIALTACVVFVRRRRRAVTS